jgi:hypothetical protein
VAVPVSVVLAKRFYLTFQSVREGLPATAKGIYEPAFGLSLWQRQPTNTPFPQRSNGNSETLLGSNREFSGWF